MRFAAWCLVLTLAMTSSAAFAQSADPPGSTPLVTWLMRKFEGLRERRAEAREANAVRATAITTSAAVKPTVWPESLASKPECKRGQVAKFDEDGGVWACI